MPNLTGVIASAALGVRMRGVERGDLGLAARRSRLRSVRIVPDRRPAARRAAPAGRTGWAGRARRSCGAAAPPARPRAAGRSGRGCPR